MKAEWISIKDRLPEKSCKVLVSTNQSGVGDMWFSKEFGWHLLKNDAKVTHWMPLPEPPTQ